MKAAIEGGTGRSDFGFGACFLGTDNCEAGVADTEIGGQLILHDSGIWGYSLIVWLLVKNRRKHGTRGGYEVGSKSEWGQIGNGRKKNHENRAIENQRITLTYSLSKNR